MGLFLVVYIMCMYFVFFWKKIKIFDVYFKLVESLFYIVKDILIVRNQVILYFVKYMYMVDCFKLFNKEL